jgi:hypothetical protein
MAIYGFYSLVPEEKSALNAGFPEKDMYRNLKF